MKQAGTRNICSFFLSWPKGFLCEQQDDDDDDHKDDDDGMAACSQPIRIHVEI